MRIWISTVALLLAAVSTALSVVDSAWTRSIHPGRDIYSVHVCDTMGASTDDSTVVLWDVRTGTKLDSLKFGARHVRGAWLISGGDVVVVYVLDSTRNTRGSLLWIDRSSKALIDSLKQIFRDTTTSIIYTKDEFAAVSDADSIVIVSCMQANVSSPCNQWFGIRRKIDIKRHAFIVNLEGENYPVEKNRPRFESRDSVVAYVPPLYVGHPVFRSISPTGRYQYHGAWLYNVRRRIPVRGSNQGPWYVARYGPTDATILAFRRRDTADATQQTKSFLQLCVVNVFTDSVLQIADTIEAGVWNTWSDRTGRTNFTFGNGNIHKSIIDTNAYHVESACVISVPDRVVSDSLYLIGADITPLDDPLSLVVDKGDGSPILRTLYCSWHAPGSYTCRAGVVQQQDTTWVCSKRITVSARNDTPTAVERFFLERSSVLSIDIARHDSILVSTDNGWLVAFDRGLHTVGCVKAQSRMDGACWTSANDLQCCMSAVSSELGCDRHVTSYGVGVHVDVGFADLTTSSLRVTDGWVAAVNALLNGRSVGTTAQTLGADRAGTLWCLTSTYTYDQPRSGDWPPPLAGGIRSIRSGRVTVHGKRSSGNYPYFNYYGILRTAGISSDGSHIAGLFYNSLPTSNRLTKHFALFDIAADSIVELIDGFDVAEIRCIGEEHAVADSTWLTIHPFRVVGTHSFERPFAEDAVPGHAIAWKEGWFYSFSPNGRVHDSVQADIMRPTVIRVFPDGRIIAGYSSGMVAVYGGIQRDLTDDPTEGGTNLIPLSCWPSPTTSELSYALPPSMTTPATMEIYDLQGRLCGTTTLTGHHGQVDITSIMNMEATGVFIVRAYAASVVAYAKIVVVK